jgi:regulator of sirC expression with transglutaminase-like and TPR domain
MKTPPFRRLASCGPALLQREIAQHAREALLRFVVLLPAPEIADVARTQLGGLCQWMTSASAAKLCPL